MRQVTPRPSSCRLFGVELEPDTWTDGLVKVIREMHSRHSVFFRALMLSLPRWNGCSGNSRMAVDPQADPKFPDQFPVDIPTGLKLHRGYNVPEVIEASKMVVFAFGYPKESVRWTY